MDRRPAQLGRTIMALGLLACAAAAMAVLGWINYDLLTEAYGSGPPHYGRTANMDKWTSLPKDLQDILLQVSDEYMDVYARNQIEFTRTARKELIAGIDGKKVVFHDLSEEERKRWAKAGESFTKAWLEKMEKKGIDGPAFLAKLEKVTAKWEAKLKAEGYPWEKTN